MSTELNILKEVTARLNKLGIPYMITGSIAANFYAVPRMTRDVDIVIELKKEGVERLCGVFEDDFYIDRDMVTDAVRKTGIFNAIHFQSVFKVDFIIRKDDPYRIEEFRRRKKIEVEGQEFYITAPEDLILSKLYWLKESLSDLQMNDVKNILKQTKGLDQDYIGKWAGYLGVEDLYRGAKK